MKIKSEYVLRKTAGTWIAMVVSGDNSDIDGVLTLNETGALLWEAMEKGCELEDLVCILTNEYEIDHAQAMEDATVFVAKLRGFGCIV